MKFLSKKTLYIFILIFLFAQNIFLLIVLNTVIGIERTTEDTLLEVSDEVYIVNNRPVCASSIKKSEKEDFEYAVLASKMQAELMEIEEIKFLEAMPYKDKNSVYVDVEIILFSDKNLSESQLDDIRKYITSHVADVTDENITITIE